MKEVKILLEKTQQVKEFIAITQNYEDEVILRTDKHAVDGKSILGVFSLDLSEAITVEIYGDKADQLAAALKKFAA